MEPKDRVGTGSKAELGERRHVTDQGEGGQTGEETRRMGQADLGGKGEGKRNGEEGSWSESWGRWRLGWGECERMGWPRVRVCSSGLELFALSGK